MAQNPGDSRPNDGQANQTGEGQQPQQSQQTEQGQGGQQPQQSQQTQQGQGGQQSQGPGSKPGQRTAGERITSWFTETILRSAVAVFGVILVLLALGQLAGVDLLGILGEFLTSSVGVYLLIAFFGVLLLVAASKSWNISDQ